MKSIKKLLACMLMVMVVGSLVGCTSDGDYMNSATDTTKEDGVIDEVIDDVKDGVEDLTDDAMDGVENLTDDAVDGVEDTVDDVKEGTDEGIDEGIEIK